jgi:hypothetical protein
MRTFLFKTRTAPLGMDLDPVPDLILDLVPDPVPDMVSDLTPDMVLHSAPDLFPGDRTLPNDAVRNTDLTKVATTTSEYGFSSVLQY